MRYFTDALGTSLSEEQTHSHMKILGMADESKQHGGGVVCLQPPVLHVHYPLDDAGLPHITHVYRRLKAGKYRGGVVDY